MPSPRRRARRRSAGCSTGWAAPSITRRIPGLDDALISLGRLLEGGTTADLATVIHSGAQIVKDKGAELGRIFAELRQITPVLAGRAPDLATAIDNLNSELEVEA